MAYDSTEYKWNDIELFLNGVPVVKFTGIRENMSQEVEEIYGGGDEPQDLQTGNRKYGGSVNLYATQINKMNAVAMAAGFRDLMDVPWTITWCYKPVIGSPRKTITYTGARIEGYEEGMEQNAKAAPVTLPFKSLRPIRK